MVEDLVDELDREGYALLPAAASPEQVAAARADLEQILEHTPTGRDDFEGRRTRRVYALFAKTRQLDAFALHPEILGVLDRVLGDYQLSAPAAIAAPAGTPFLAM